VCSAFSLTIVVLIGFGVLVNHAAAGGSFSSQGASAERVALITIANRPPIVEDDTNSIKEDTAPNPISGNVLANDSDPDGNTLSVTNAGTLILSYGILVIHADGSYTYTLDNSNSIVEALNNGQSQTDNFTYNVSDGHGGTASAVLRITINGTTDNRPPVLEDDANSVKEDSAPNPITGNVLANDSDPDGNTLSVTNAGTVTLSYGVLVIHADGSYTYTLDNTNPAMNTLDNGETLDDTFTYRVSDGHGGTESAKLTVTIDGNSDYVGPIAVDDSKSVKEDTAPNPVSGNVLTNDSHTNGASISVIGTGTFSLDHGTLVINSDGSYTFTLDNSNPAVDSLNTGQTLTDSFTYVVSDGLGGFDAAKLAITIHGTTDNRSPTAEEDVNSIKEDTAPNPISGNVLTNDSDADGNTLSVTNAGTFSLSHGSLVIHADGTYAYTLDNSNPAVNALNNGQHLTDTFTYNISDGHGGTDSASLQITINGSTDNAPPSAEEDSNSIKEDTAPNPISGNVLTNDSDAEGDLLSVTNAGTYLLGYGSIEINDDGAYIYTLDNADANVEALNDGQTLYDNFFYTISDGNGGTDEGLLYIIINGTTDNRAPISDDDLNSVTEDAAPNPVSGNVLTNDSDPDGNALSVTNTGDLLLSHGSLAMNADGTYSYTLLNSDPAVDALNAGETLTDGFTYSVSDGHGGTDSGNLSITINGANDAPIAVDDPYTIDEDSDPFSFNVLTNDSDVDGGALSISAASIGTFALDHGSLTLDANGDAVYTPNANANGEDTLVYSVSDGNGGTDTATITITITPVNDAPVANDDDATTDEEVAVTIDVLSNDTDVDLDTFTIKSISAPTHGSAEIVDGKIVYTPDANWSGDDSFTYTIGDGSDFESTATVSVNVIEVNDPPVAVDDEATTDEDAPVSIDVLANDTDIDLDSLTISAVGTPGNGTAEIVNKQIVYTPNANFHGTDSFTYTVSDGRGGMDEGNVAITIDTINDDPVAVDDDVTINEDEPRTIDVLANDGDLDLDALTISAVGASNHGTVEMVNEQIIYTPNANYFGSDSFTYTASDGQGEDEGSVQITINAVNDKPLATDDAATTNEDEPVTIDVLFNDTDVDLDELTISAVGALGYGTAEIIDGQIVYTPNANYHGTDSFTYDLSDGQDGDDQGLVEITINSVNDQPVATNDAAVTDEDTAIEIDAMANDGDTEGDALELSSVADPANGSAEMVAGQIRYTPDANFHGSDTFEYTISDENGAFGTALVTVTVNPVNDPPVANPAQFSGVEDQAFTGSLASSASDVDDNHLQFSSAPEVAAVTPGGSVEIAADGSFTYTPSSDVHGSDSFAYQVCDPSLACATNIATITVESENDAPIAGADSFQVAPGGTITGSVGGNDSDPDGDTLTFAQKDNPSQVPISFNSDGTFTFTAPANATGNYEITYSATDPGGLSATAMMTFVIIDAPGITLTKTSDATGPLVTGDIITYTFTVTNIGNLPLTAVSIDDSLLGIIACANELPFGETVTCTGTYVVTADDATAGTVFNSATASALTPDGATVMASAELSVGVCQPGTTPPLETGGLELGVRALQAVIDGTPVVELPTETATSEATVPAEETPAETVTVEPTATATIEQNVDPADETDGSPTTTEDDPIASPTSTPSCQPIPQPTSPPSNGGVTGPVVSQLPSTGADDSIGSRNVMVWAFLIAAFTLAFAAFGMRRFRTRE
jgi:uncharacterized repeat protein (TIGR01451 family)